jgi:hypothetical protein
VPGAAGAVGWSGALVLAIGLASRLRVPVALGLMLVGAGYTLSLLGRGLDPAAGLVAGGLVGIAELAYWALEREVPCLRDPALARRRVVLIVAVSVGAVVLGTLLADLAALDAGGGAPLGAAAVVASAVLLTVVLALVRSLGRPPVR